MDSKLEALLKQAAHHIMTPEEIYEQKVSWIYGEVNMDHPDFNLIGELEIREALKLHGIFPPAPSKPNAAPQGGPTASHSVAWADHSGQTSPATAAPDEVARMVRRLRDYANHFGGRVEDDLCEAAALLERLGHVAACPRPKVMGEHACKDRTQCWEPCGDLGHHEEYARPVPGGRR